MLPQSPSPSSICHVPSSSSLLCLPRADTSFLAETLLDDFLLTYTVFMTTDDLCQALLRQYPSSASGWWWGRGWAALTPAGR